MADTIGGRIREVRKKNRMTTISFAERLGVTNPAISQLENDKTNLSDRMCRDICREFNISETWLRTGEGDMHPPESRDQTISRFLGDLLHDQPDFRHRLITALATMTVDEWELLERKIREIAEEKPDP